MAKINEALAEIVAECDRAVAEAHKIVGNTPEGEFQGADEAQVSAIVARICQQHDGDTDRLIVSEVRAAMKEKAWVFKPKGEKAEK